MKLSRKKEKSRATITSAGFACYVSLRTLAAGDQRCLPSRPSTQEAKHTSCIEYHFLRATVARTVQCRDVIFNSPTSPKNLVSGELGEIQIDQILPDFWCYRTSFY
jgi:hypothetical protein